MEKEWEMARAFETLYAKNAPRRRVSLSNRLILRFIQKLGFILNAHTYLGAVFRKAKSLVRR
jgi:hypothetical protein